MLSLPELRFFPVIKAPSTVLPPLHPEPRRWGQLLYEWAWRLTAEWPPKPFNPWRLVLLKAFGAQIEGRPFIHPRMRTNKPWNLRIEDRACAGDRTNLYAHAPITLKAGCIVAQEAYLCTGWHDLATPAKTLLARPILIGEDAFVGARAFVLPGITIGAQAIVGAGAVVTRDVPPGITVVGNPARPVKAHQNQPPAQD